MQVIRWIDIGQYADIIRNILDDLATLSAVDIYFNIAISAGILYPLDRGEPGSSIKSGRIIHIVSTTLQGRLQACLRNTPIAIVRCNRCIEAQFVIRLGFLRARNVTDEN